MNLNDLVTISIATLDMPQTQPALNKAVFSPHREPLLKGLAAFPTNAIGNTRTALRHFSYAGDIPV